MSDRTPAPADLELGAGLEPPMANGEVLFEEPWQGRVFGMARTLATQGLYSWDEFRAHLIDAIGRWDRGNSEDSSEGSEYRYYDHFLIALQALLEEKRLLDSGSIEARTSELSARPHGHDH